MDCAIDTIFANFSARGHIAYGEHVSIEQHMLQTAYHAERDGAAPSLIVAALLHDYGYLTEHLPSDITEHAADSRHEEKGASALESYFDFAVTQPVRLHVAAKRYLCATDPDYAAALSSASVYTLNLQGGPFDHAEVAVFEQNLYFADAVRLRRYDDHGKTRGLAVPDLTHYRPYLESLLARSAR